MQKCSLYTANAEEVVLFGMIWLAVKACHTSLLMYRRNNRMRKTSIMIEKWHTNFLQKLKFLFKKGRSAPFSSKSVVSIHSMDKACALAYYL
jgi:hypothetical protein